MRATREHDPHAMRRDHTPQASRREPLPRQRVRPSDLAIVPCHSARPCRPRL
jgi:hypothetical protein